MLSSVSNSASARALASSVLPTPVGPEEDERADRAARVLDAGAGADDRVGDELHGLVLADDALVQDLVEAQQLLPLALHAGGLTGMPVQRETISAISSSVTTSRSSRALALLVVELLLLGLQPPLELGQPAVAQLGGAVEVVVALGLLGLAPHLLELLAQLLHLADRLALGLPLGPHRVGLGAQVGELLAQLLQPLPGWPGRSPCSSAASSISSRITRRVISSSSGRHASRFRCGAWRRPRRRGRSPCRAGSGR